MQGAAGSTVPLILELTSITKHFVHRLGIIDSISNRLQGLPGHSVIRAVDGVSLSVAKNEVVALVGESGCGKSTIGRIAACVLEPTNGHVVFDGQPISERASPAGLSRRLKIQMIFQNPSGSLNPRHSLRRIVGEPALVHGLVRKSHIDDFVDSLMQDVGLDASLKSRRPQDLSGGQCQRVGIARALSVDPEILVCDEPISALDVSIQAQILNLFLDLRERRTISYIFISHDLAVVERFSDRVAVMYLGRVVEISSTKEVFGRPNHPYTQVLLSSIARLDQRRRTFVPAEGEVPSPMRPPSGCHFHPRCPHVMTRCRSEKPELKEIASGHWSACHLNEAA